MEKSGFIYILTNKNKTTLYIGVTSDLPKRIFQHKIRFLKTHSLLNIIWNIAYIMKNMIVLNMLFNGKRKSKNGIERKRKN